MAGYTAAVKLHNLVITLLTTLANGISNFTSQNLGAEKPEHIKSGFWAGLKMVWIICVPLLLAYCFAGKYLVTIFINTPTETAVETGRMLLLIISPFYMIISSKLVTDGILRGSKMMIKFMISTFTDLILRVILAIILSVPLGTTGIWIAWSIGWTVATVLSVLFYRTGIWYKEQALNVRDKRILSI